MAKISVAVPVHQMNNWQFFLGRLLTSFLEQQYEDKELVISDDSSGDEVSDFILEKVDPKSLQGEVVYFKNGGEKGMAVNSNNAILQSTGELVKILYMDDYFASPFSLGEIVDNFSGEWLVSGCLHDDGKQVKNFHAPLYTDDIITGNNCIGSPSVLTMRREGALYFDTSLSWLLDCDLYKRLYEKYGPPTIVNTPNVIIGIGQHQTTHTLSHQRKQQEHEYLLKKYAS